MANKADPTSARAGGRAFLSLIRTLAAFAGRRGLLAIGYIAAGALFEGVGIILIVPLLAVVMGGGGGHGMLHDAMARIFAVFGITTPFGRLALMLSAFALIMVIRGIVIALRDITTMNLQAEFIGHLRGEIAAALANAGWDQILRLRHARIINILSNDITRIATMSQFLLQAGISIVLLIAQCVLAFVLSPGLALFAFGLLAITAIAMVPALRRARLLGRHVSGANLALIDTASQFLNGLKLAVSQDLQGGFVVEFRETIRSLIHRQTGYFRQATLQRIALTTLSAIVGAVVVLLGYGVFGLAAPVLIAFLLVIARMSGPVAQIQQGFQQLAHGLPAYESITELLAELHSVTLPRGAAREIPAGPIVLEDVSFQHAQTDGTQSHGVRRASLTLPPGSFIGIAGASGSGKTTLADLLVGLLRPQSGRVVAGGCVLDETTLPAWRTQLGYISQDPFLFHDTVRRNLLWARPEASESDMWDALTLAGADGIVRRMDGGLDGVVGERGTLVSGGERQRIALARALLRKPKLLVMDEATNAIDIAGERALLERLLATAPRPTIVMIAHRAESLALCDHVVRMENGELHDDVPAQAAG
ncbi:MAG: ABC transporter ATP-binding protein [Rhizomicrobium sp.]